MEIGNIVKGTINNVLGKNEDLYEERILICYSCSLYSDRLGGICNNKLWMNPNTGDVSTYLKEGYKRGCGCILGSKTRLPNAHCPLNKW